MKVQRIKQLSLTLIAVVIIACAITHIWTKGGSGAVIYYYFNFVVLVLSMLFIVGLGCHILYAMKKHHNFEYKRHKRRVFTMTVLMFICIYITVREYYFESIGKLIWLTDNKFNISDPNLTKSHL